MDAVLKGKLFPGERLLESKLAEEFKCSQTPVREALRQLESEGLLTFEQNKGSTIRKLSTQEIADIWSIIAVLESYAAWLSTQWATEKDAVYLRGLHNKLKRTAETHDLAKWLQFNMEFHNFFSEHSGNKILFEILQNLRHRIYQYRYTTVSIHRHLAKYVGHHESVLKAYEASDGKMAQRHMKIHIEAFRDALVSHLSEFPGFK